VTAEYLGVPGSGYGQRPAVPSRQDDVSRRLRSEKWSAAPERGAAGGGSAELGERPPEAEGICTHGGEASGAGGDRGEEGSGVESPSTGPISGDQGPSRRQSAGWVATIPVAEMGRRPRRRSAPSSDGENLSAGRPGGGTVRSREGSDRDRVNPTGQDRGPEGRPGSERGGGGAGQSWGGGAAVGRKRPVVKSRVREEIEAQRKYEEQKAAVSGQRR
jgi:hypothetical protein